MKTYRLRTLFSALLLTLSCATSTAHAVIIDSGTVIPDEFVLLNFNNSGLDWVYAGPIAPEERGAGNIHPATYRAAEGWRTASAAEWLARPEWFDFIKPGFELVVNAVATFTNHDQYLFASEYWSDFRHVDLNDYAAGRVTDGVNGAVQASVPETIYVRTSRVQPPREVPAPATLALLGLGLLMVRVVSRKTA